RARVEGAVTALTAPRRPVSMTRARRDHGASERRGGQREAGGEGAALRGAPGRGPAALAQGAEGPARGQRGGRGARGEGPARGAAGAGSGYRGRARGRRLQAR